MSLEMKQNYHFSSTLKVSSKENGPYEWADGLSHFFLWYGLSFPEGRMKSREGTIVDADDLSREDARLQQRKFLWNLENYLIFRRRERNIFRNNRNGCTEIFSYSKWTQRKT